MDNPRSALDAITGPSFAKSVPTGPSSISADFNASPIPAGRTIWFTSFLKKVTGLPGAGGTIRFGSSTIQFTARGTAYSLAVPAGVITLSSTVSQASTTFDAASGLWRTVVPVSYAGNVFLTGLAYPVPADLPGSITGVTWTGTFTSLSSGLTATWQWGAAVYLQFATDNNGIGVKPVDGAKLNPYANSDKAGTPESWKTYVTSGAASTGGTNWTGTPSSAATSQPSPGAATTTSLVTTSSATLASGTAAQVTLQTKDPAGNNLSAGGFAVAFTTAGGTSTGTMSATTDNGNGSYTATYTGVLAGTATTIGATIDGSAVTSPLPTITVTPGSVSTATSAVTSSKAAVASGTTATLTLQAQDAAGNRLTTGGLTVAFTASGGTSTGAIGATTDHGDGTYTATFTGVSAGTATTIGTLINGTLVTSTLPTITVTAGAASLATSLVTASSATLASGTATTLTLQAKDAGGNDLGTGGLAVAFTQSPGKGGSTGTISATSDNGNGTYTATFVGVIAGGPTTIGATIGGSPVTSTLPTITVTPGAASPAMSTITTSSAIVSSGTTATLTLRSRDAAGNSLTAGGLTVAFTVAGGTSTGTIGATTDNNDGTYTAIFTGVVAGTPTTVEATINGSSVTSALPGLTVTPVTASSVTSTVTVSSAVVISGATATLALEARDPAGNRLTTGGATVVFTATGGTSLGAIGATTDHGDGTYTATFTPLRAGTATTIGATIDGSPVTSPLPTIRVTTASTATSVVTTSIATVASGTTAILTLQTREPTGDNLTTGGLAVQLTASGGTSTGSITATTDNGNGTYTASFTGVLAGSATTIEATINGDPVTSSLPSITVIPGAVSTATSRVTTSAPTVTPGTTATLTLVARDAAGNSLTTGGLTVAFTASGGTSTGTIGATADHGDGAYTATFTGVSTGTATTIGALINESPVTSTLPTISVIAASAATSVITTSSPTVASGMTATLTLQAKDANGTNLTTGGLAVTFTQSPGKGGSTGTISATTDNANGTYTATFTGELAGTATAIGATINGSPVTSPLPTIAVIPGAVSIATSQVFASSAAVQSGTTATLTLGARDAFGNQLTTGGLTVVFAAAGGASTGTISGTTDNGNGTYSAVFTGVVAGTSTTIGATVNGSPVTSTLPTIAVTPGVASPATSTVTTSSAIVLSGFPAILTLHTKDAAGNSLTTGGATVVFTASGGTSTGAITAASDNGNGTYTATFTGGTAGTATTIGATVDGSPLTSTLPTIRVTTASTATSMVTTSSATAVAGTTATLNLQAKDPTGNSLPMGGLAVVFTASGGSSTGAISVTTDNGNGTYSATFTAIGAGTPTTIGATINGSLVTSPLPTITVIPGAVSTGTSRVKTSSATVAPGTTATLTLEARDALGNRLTAGGLTVVFAASGGTSTGTIGTTTDHGDGTYTATFTGVTVGTATLIGATIDGTAVTGGSAFITVISASTATSVVSTSSTTVQSGTAATLTLQAKDPAGNNLTTGGLTVIFAVLGAEKGSSVGAISATTDNGNGTYTATFTGALVGAVTIEATIEGSPVTSPLPTITVIPGPVSRATSYVLASSASVASGSTATLTLHTSDAAGNNLTAGGLGVVFTASGGTSTGSITAATDNGDGTYAATFTGERAGTATTIGTTIDGSPVTSSPPTIMVTPAAASTATSVVTTSSGTVVSGATATLSLQAKDAFGNDLTTGGSAVVFTASGGSSTGTVGGTIDHGNGTYTASFTGVLAGTPTVVGATLNGSAVTSALPTITVSPGAPSLVASAVTTSSATLASGTTATLTLQAKDAAGNSLTTSGLTVVFTTITPPGAGTGTISATTDNGNGSYTATFTGVLAGTATTIRATINGSQVQSPLPTITVTPGPASTTTSAVTTSSTIVPSGTTATLTLRTKDAAGNSLTAGGLVVVFTASGGTSGGAIGPTSDHGNGTYTAVFTGLVAGTPTIIGATIAGSPVTSTLPIITVTPFASTTTSVVTTSTASIASGATATLTLQSKDAAGQNLTTGGLVVAFTRSGGTSTGTIGATSDHGDGTYTATFTGVLVGTATTIGATIGGAAVTSTLPTITVTPGPASPATSFVTTSSPTVLSGGTATLTLQAIDAAGNELTAGGLSVTFTSSGGTSTGTIGATTDNGDGTYAATFTGVLVGTAATIGATIGGSPVTSTLPTITVTPGAASPATSLVTTSSPTVISGGTATLTLQAKDAAGNNLTAGGLAVTFTPSGGTSTGTISATTDQGDGTYSATFTAVLAGLATAIGATINGAPVTSALPAITVTPGAVSTATSRVLFDTIIPSEGSTGITLPYGNTQLVYLLLRDAAGNAVYQSGLVVIFTATGGTSTGTFGPTTFEVSSGRYSAEFTGVSPGTATSIGATIDGSPVTSALPTITVTDVSLAQSRVGVEYGFGVVPPYDPVGVPVTLILSARDSSGQFFTTGGRTVVFTSSGAPNAGTIGPTTDNGNGTYSATFTGVTAGTSATIAATIDGSPVTSPMPTVTVVPYAVTISPSSATIATGSVLQLVAVARDRQFTPIEAPAPVWDSRSPLVATVDQSGLVTGVGPGTATITATVQGVVTGTAQITVTGASP